jgi:four helix bundle protein
MTNDEKPARSHKDLPVWQQAMSLAEAVFRLTDEFAADSRFSLAEQLHRAAISIPSSIAEGAARSDTGDLGHYLGVALGAVASLETQLELAKRLDFVDDTAEATGLLENVRKQLIVYRRSLRA